MMANNGQLPDGYLHNESIDPEHHAKRPIPPVQQPGPPPEGQQPRDQPIEQLSQNVSSYPLTIERRRTLVANIRQDLYFMAILSILIMPVFYLLSLLVRTPCMCTHKCQGW